MRAVRLLRRRERQEPYRVPGDRREEHAAVEGHERQHGQVREPHAQRVQQRPEDAGGDAGLDAVEEAAVGEPLDEDAEDEDKDEGEGVHAGPGARPPGEEDLGLRSPEEGHVRHHHLVVVGCRRRRPVHAGHVAVVHGRRSSGEKWMRIRVTSYRDW